MKRLYWRPQKCSAWTVLAIALVSLAAMAAVELLPSKSVQPLHEAKLRSAHIAGRSLAVIKAERTRRGHAIDRQFDPSGSGLIGAEMTPVTSVTGHLGAKQTSVNPNFAALVMELLHEAGVQEGDCVAVGCSGSFPSLNVAVYAALEVLHARPIIIASAAASQFGANLPDLLWIDMEQALREKGCTSCRSVAVSLGGYEDRALGISDEGKQLLRDAIARNDLELLTSQSFSEAIDRRMEVYHEVAADRPIKAYINVGGGSVSVGRALGKKLYQPGLNLELPPGAGEIDSVMTRFAKSGTPVVHLVHVEDLARLHGFPVAPTHIPAVGEGTVYTRRDYNPWLAGACLAAILLLLRACVLTDQGARLLSALGIKRHPVRQPALPGEADSGGSALMV